MCSMNGFKPMVDNTLEELYKGKRHELAKWIEETQMDGVDCFV